MQRERKVCGESDPSVDFGRTSEHPDVTLRGHPRKSLLEMAEKFGGEITENSTLAGSWSKMINRWIGESSEC